MKYLLILGAASDIAKAVAKKYAQNGFSLYLAGREQEKSEIEADANDLMVRYEIDAQYVPFDACDFASHQTIYDTLEHKPEGVACFVGYLGDQPQSQSDFSETMNIINTNYTGCVSMLNIIANDMEEKRAGFIIGVSSVAGDRGRQSNYTYGSAKAAFTAYLSGLRHRLSKVGVHVMTVKPGFVNTRMTEGMELPQALLAEPNDVAEDIYKGQQKQRNTIYTMWVWRYIMMIIRNIPEFIFKKSNL